MRVRLIYPRSQATNDAVYGSSRFLDCFFRLAAKIVSADIYRAGKRAFHVPPLNLMLLAAFLPPEVDVEIIDERIRPIDFRSDADLVGITCMTADATHVYEMADEYRHRGVKVVLGGIHPTVLPHEACAHADAVVVGECDDLVQEIIRDAKENRLQRFYSRRQLHDLRQLPNPRKDLLDDRYYITRNVVQATRGCPYRCSFCSVSIVAGPTYRFRPVQDVIGEIQQCEGSFVSFLDDNLGGDIPYVLDLLRLLAPLKIQWSANMTTAALRNARVLESAARSGCKIVLIGFESLSQRTLNNIQKPFNRASQYVQLIRQIRAAGIGIIGSFMLGLDEADDDVEQIIELAMNAPLDMAQISIVTPYPGTQLFDQMDTGRRIMTRDWRYFDTTSGNVVFTPKNCSAAELQRKYLETMERLYSVYGLASRLLRSRRYPIFFVPYNIRQRKKIKALRAVIEARGYGTTRGGTCQ